MKNYTKLDELKSENAILKTKIRKLEFDLKVAKDLINVTHEINLDLLNEIERLNNIIKEQSLLLIEFQDMEQRLKRKDNIIDKAIHYINLNQDSKSLCLNYTQLKALRGILRQDEFYLNLFERQLKELKEDDK